MEEKSDMFEYEWWENIDEDEFQDRFRMFRKTFIALQAELDEADGIDNENTDTFLLCCLWILGNTRPFEEAVGLFGINDVEGVLLQYAKKITALGNTYLAWPDEEEAIEIEKGFLHYYNFPGVIGVVGSLHITISSETKHSLYFNTKMKKHTIVLQAVCDNNLLLRDVCVGCPGGKGIKTILKSSPLYKKLTDEDDYLVKNNNHLLGGTKHPQMKTLLTPYKGIELNEKETKFNILHHSVMSTVEKTFSCLESRFPRLTCTDTLNPHMVTLLVSATCVLHNFTRVRRDSCDSYCRRTMY